MLVTSRPIQTRNRISPAVYVYLCELCSRRCCCTVVEFSCITLWVCYFTSVQSVVIIVNVVLMALLLVLLLLLLLLLQCVAPLFRGNLFCGDACATAVTQPPQLAEGLVSVNYASNCHCFVSMNCVVVHPVCRIHSMESYCFLCKRLPPHLLCTILYLILCYCYCLVVCFVWVG